MAKNKDIFIAEDDGLTTHEVGSWAEAKYKIIYDYDTLFSTGMKRYWDQRVYIDLYSGTGKARIRGTKKIVYSSPLLALNVENKFDKYIFCDVVKANIDSLKRRVHEEFPENHVTFVLGDCNERIDKIIGEIPIYSKSKKVLSFCFVDPFSLKISFETIKKLGEHILVDFLILLAFGMDGKRNIKLYVDENHDRIDDFLGLADWRERWEKSARNGVNLVKFLADEFTSQMVKIGYRREAINNFISIRSDEKNLPLYYLAFFSKHPTGYDFWNKVRKRNTEPELDF